MRQTKSIPRRIYISALLVLMFVSAAGFWYGVIRLVSRPYQLDYGEGIVLYQASKVTDLRTAYKPIEQYPFVVFHYPPLYHLTVRILALTTGSLISAGRWLSVASGVLIELTIGILVFFSLPRWHGLSPRWMAAVFAGVLPSLLGGMVWTRLVRVDMLALLFSIAGLTVFVLSPAQPARQYLAFVLFIAALFTKQTLIAAPLACLTAALIVDPRHGVRLALFCGLLGATLLAGLSLATHGQAIKHLFLYNQNPFSLGRMARALSENYRDVVPIIALAAGSVLSAGFDLLAVVRRKRWRALRAWLLRNRYRRGVLVCTLFLIVAVFISFSSGKEGAASNYFLEWNLACCPLAGFLLYRQLAYWRDGARWAPGVMVAYVLPILVMMGGVPVAVKHFIAEASGEAIEEAKREETSAEVLKLVKQARGPVFSEDMMLLYEAGKEVPAEPAIIQSLAAARMWDESPFLRMIQEHRFPLIVVLDLSDKGRYTPAVRAAIEQSYIRTREIGKYKIYEPRSDGEL